MDLIFVRLLFIVVVALTCFLIEPFGQTRYIDAGVGAVIGAAIVLFEWKLRSVSLKRLIGAAIGSFLGICGAYLFALVILVVADDGGEGERAHRGDLIMATLITATPHHGDPARPDVTTGRSGSVP